MGEDERPVSNLDSAPSSDRGLPVSMLSFSPHEGAVTSPTAPITVAFRADPESDYGLELDGHDVTSDCLVRETMTMPASRVELTYRPDAPLASGEHTVVARCPSVEYTWAFTVAPEPGV